MVLMKGIAMIYLDIAKAFDMVWQRQGRRRHMSWSGHAPPHLFQILMFLLY